MIVVTTDKGPVRRFNTNVLRWRSPAQRTGRIGAKVRRSKSLPSAKQGLFRFHPHAVGAIVCRVIGLGDTPHLEKLIGPSPMLDASKTASSTRTCIYAFRSVNTMKQEAVVRAAAASDRRRAGRTCRREAAPHRWDYIYEPMREPSSTNCCRATSRRRVYQAVPRTWPRAGGAHGGDEGGRRTTRANVINELQLRSTTRPARPRSKELIGNRRRRCRRLMIRNQDRD